jgi:hypothetical protein
MHGLLLLMHHIRSILLLERRGEERIGYMHACILHTDQCDQGAVVVGY